MLSALEQTSVPVALKPGQAPNEKLVVSALHAALQGELQRTLGVAAPPVPGSCRVGIRGARGRRAAPPPDALDALIAGAPADDDEEEPAMKALINAEVAIQAAVSAAQNYADIVTDRDPDDGEHVVPGELRRFLARLRLLHGVPFSYLVPDAKLLPIESIRFFYIDRAWTDALVQGALSVGTISSADRTQLEAVYPHIRAEVDEAERTIRQPQGRGAAARPAAARSPASSCARARCRAGPTCTCAPTRATWWPTTR